MVRGSVLTAPLNAIEESSARSKMPALPCDFLDTTPANVTGTIADSGTTETLAEVGPSPALLVAVTLQP